MKKIKTIKEEDYNDESIEWERSVKIIKWTHDIEHEIYIIEYSE